tara:strand:+ start:137 stop:445 length:309 start_codon:yes stop_codon:yes gene_type:complete
MANAKKVNYSPELTAEIISYYTLEKMTVDEIAKIVGKSVRSVRSKLVREGVYVAKEKVATRVNVGPTKKDLLRSLEASGFDTKGFDGATKEALTRLIGIVAN